MRDLEFEKCDRVFLMVIPFKKISRFHKKKKLNPQFDWPFKILDWIGTTVYILALPPELFRVHNVFLVSMLHKYNLDLSHILSHELLLLQEDLSYEEVPIDIVDRKSKVLHNWEIPFIKVLWQNYMQEEVTQELELSFRAQYHQLFNWVREWLIWKIKFSKRERVVILEPEKRPEINFLFFKY